MKVSVGSTNPVKIAATRAVFSRFTPDLELISLAVSSGVPVQPWGDDQTRSGALNRARATLTAGAELGVGFEGGLLETPYGVMTCAWCAVVDSTGVAGLGGGVNLLLPPDIARRVRGGEELGPAMDALIGQHNTKQGPGAVGILTNGLIDRQRAYEHILIMALAPFRRPDLYRDAGLRPALDQEDRMRDE